MSFTIKIDSPIVCYVLDYFCYTNSTLNTSLWTLKPICACRSDCKFLPILFDRLFMRTVQWSFPDEALFPPLEDIPSFFFYYFLHNFFFFYFFLLYLRIIFLSCIVLKIILFEKKKNLKHQHSFFKCIKIFLFKLLKQLLKRRMKNFTVFFQKQGIKIFPNSHSSLFSKTLNTH